MLEALDVHPRNVVLYVRGQPAGCDELTLAQVRGLCLALTRSDEYLSDVACLWSRLACDCVCPCSRLCTQNMCVHVRGSHKDGMFCGCRGSPFCCCTTSVNRLQTCGCTLLTVTSCQAEIFPDEEIRALITGDHPDDDYASLFDSAGGKRREVEMGFKNTALTGMGAGAAPAAEDRAGGSGQGGNGEHIDAAGCEDAAGCDDGAAEVKAGERLGQAERRQEAEVGDVGTVAAEASTNSSRQLHQHKGGAAATNAVAEDVDMCEAGDPQDGHAAAVDPSPPH